MNDDNTIFKRVTLLSFVTCFLIIVHYLHKYYNSMRICSWNLEFFGVDKANHNTDTHYQNIASYIKQINPDILCLQEISSIQAIKQLEQLLHDYVLLMNHIEVEDKPQFNVFLVKNHVRVMEHKTINPKMVEMTYFDTFLLQPVTIYNCHLRSDFSGINIVKREQQLHFLLQQIMNKNVIITGDFNCESDSKELEELTKKSFINVFVGKNMDAINYRYSHWYDKNNSQTIDNGELSQIDHFFVTPTMNNKIQNVYVDNQPCTTGLNTMNTTMNRMSDHCPIIMEVR